MSAQKRTRKAVETSHLDITPNGADERDKINKRAEKKAASAEKQPGRPAPGEKDSSPERKLQLQAKPAALITTASTPKSQAKGKALKPATAEPVHEAKPAKKARKSARPAPRKAATKPVQAPAKRSVKKTPADATDQIITGQIATEAAMKIPAITLPNSEHPQLKSPSDSSLLVLMVRDPEWLYVYWTIAPTDRELHRIGQPHGAPPLLLRVFDMGRDPALPPRMEDYFDVTVIPEVNGWYVRVPHGGGQWGTALGYLDPEANFVELCQSNIVIAPNQIAVEWDETTWGPAAIRAEEDVLEIAGGPEEPRSLRAKRMVTDAAKRMTFLQGGASEQVARLKPGASGQVGLKPGASGQLVPGSGLMQEQSAMAKSFWLTVNTELIVYGATEPDARVTVQGEPVQLRPDGTFTLRFALPDGEQIIPVRAVNAGEDDERIITPIVAKQTV